MVVFSTLFLLGLVFIIFKIAYDHQLAKDVMKMEQYKHLTDSEDTDQNIY